MSDGWVWLNPETGFPDPSAFQQPAPSQAVVNDDGLVRIPGAAYRSYRPNVPIEPGTALAVRRDAVHSLWARPLVDVERERAEARAADDQRRREREQENAQARCFNAGLNVPARWLPDANVVASSDWAGRGYQRHTAVHHVRLVERLADGRLTREPGQFLCSGANRSKWGDLVSIEDRVREADAPVRVSCKACLSIASRWQGASEASPSTVGANVTDGRV
ncbi:MAG: hypothetical protein ACRCYU_23375 [Nocardioides sp.]